MKEVVKQTRFKDLELTYYNNLIGIAMILPVVLYSQEWPQLVQDNR
jgi:hypothetical protein